MLEIRDLRKKYGNFQALDGLSMTIEKGELFGFVGPNGAREDHHHQDYHRSSAA